MRMKNPNGYCYGIMQSAGLYPLKCLSYILFTIWILPLWRLLNYEAHDERVSIYKKEPLTAHLDLVTIKCYFIN